MSVFADPQATISLPPGICLLMICKHHALGTLLIFRTPEVNLCKLKALSVHFFAF